MNTIFFPRILEINTWPWLNELTQRYHHHITLDSVPESELITLVSPFDIIWLMGVWKRSPQSQKIALQHPDLQDEFRRALPEFQEEDVIGSPYAIYDYSCDPYLGGDTALRKIIQKIHTLKKKVILDFVPNHIALDHKWITAHPEYFVHGSSGDTQNPTSPFFFYKNQIFAHGKDPYFPAWTDTVQFNAFSHGYRSAVITLLKHLAQWEVDGVRADMAMLLVNSIFQQTWHGHIQGPETQEFWVEIINDVRKEYPFFLFIAEVYWDMEYTLQQQGFDFCYDKRLYDRLAHDTPEYIRGHLFAEWGYQAKLLRFIENHDEQRAIMRFGRDKVFAAAILSHTLPGAHLFYYKQFEGATMKLPVQLGSFPNEPSDQNCYRFYNQLFVTTARIFSSPTEMRWMLLPHLPLPLIGHLWGNIQAVMLTIVNYSNYSIPFHLNSDDLRYPMDTITRIEGILFPSLSNQEEEIQTQSIPPHEFLDHGIDLIFHPWESMIWWLTLERTEI